MYLLGDLNSERSEGIHGREGERKKQDLNGNGDHTVKRVTEQSVNYILVQLSLSPNCATAQYNLREESEFYSMQSYEGI